ncbi:toprim domain-containing protein [Streptomyces sp. NPDC059003]|uniref:toprim domain-containing protein n=1 Tax=Streptomyces sp. NPDC059003 TaxID=3346691 RepID=UPI0036C5EDE5
MRYSDGTADVVHPALISLPGQPRYRGIDDPREVERWEELDRAEARGAEHAQLLAGLVTIGDRMVIERRLRKGKRQEIHPITKIQLGKRRSRPGREFTYRGPRGGTNNVFCDVTQTVTIAHPATHPAVTAAHDGRPLTTRLLTQLYQEGPQRHAITDFSTLELVADGQFALHRDTGGWELLPATTGQTIWPEESLGLEPHPMPLAALPDAEQAKAFAEQLAARFTPGGMDFAAPDLHTQAAVWHEENGPLYLALLAERAAFDRAHGRADSALARGYAHFEAQQDRPAPPVGMQWADQLEDGDAILIQVDDATALRAIRSHSLTSTGLVTLTFDDGDRVHLARNTLTHSDTAEAVTDADGVLYADRRAGWAVQAGQWLELDLDSLGPAARAELDLPSPLPAGSRIRGQLTEHEENADTITLRHLRLLTPDQHRQALAERLTMATPDTVIVLRETAAAGEDSWNPSAPAPHGVPEQTLARTPSTSTTPAKGAPTGAESDQRAVQESTAVRPTRDPGSPPGGISDAPLHGADRQQHQAGTRRAHRPPPTSTPTASPPRQSDAAATRRRGPAPSPQRGTAPKPAAPRAARSAAALRERAQYIADQAAAATTAAAVQQWYTTARGEKIPHDTRVNTPQGVSELKARLIQLEQQFPAQESAADASLPVRASFASRPSPHPRTETQAAPAPAQAAQHHTAAPVLRLAEGREFHSPQDAAQQLVRDLHRALEDPSPPKDPRLYGHLNGQPLYLYSLIRKTLSEGASPGELRELYFGLSQNGADQCYACLSPRDLTDLPAEAILAALRTWAQNPKPVLTDLRRLVPLAADSLAGPGRNPQQPSPPDSAAPLAAGAPSSTDVGPRAHQPNDAPMAPPSQTSRTAPRHAPAPAAEATTAVEGHPVAGTPPTSHDSAIPLPGTARERLLQIAQQATAADLAPALLGVHEDSRQLVISHATTGDSGLDADLALRIRSGIDGYLAAGHDRELARHAVAIRVTEQQGQAMLDAPTATPAPSDGEQARLYQVLEDAAVLFAADLASSTREARAAADYLSTARGHDLHSRVAQRWQVGHARRGRNNTVTDRLRERGHTNEELVRTGILRQDPDSGALTNAFFHRLMWPQRDLEGRVIGFIGRTLSDTAKPKYLNTATDTPAGPTLYKKSHVLLGMERLRATDGPIYLGEGPTDLMAIDAAHQHAGMPLHAVVGTCGTSLTAAHVQLLKDNSAPGRPLVLVFDNDENDAGAKALLRAWPRVSSWPGPVYAVTPQGAKDLAKIHEDAQRGPSEVLRQLEQQQPLLDAVIDADLKITWNPSGTDEAADHAAAAALVADRFWEHQQATRESEPSRGELETLALACARRVSQQPWNLPLEVTLGQMLIGPSIKTADEHQRQRAHERARRLAAQESESTAPDSLQSGGNMNSPTVPEGSAAEPPTGSRVDQPQPFAERIVDDYAHPQRLINLAKVAATQSAALPDAAAAATAPLGLSVDGEASDVAQYWSERNPFAQFDANTRRTLEDVPDNSRRAEKQELLQAAAATMRSSIKDMVPIARERFAAVLRQIQAAKDGADAARAQLDAAEAELVRDLTVRLVRIIAATMDKAQRAGMGAGGIRHALHQIVGWDGSLRNTDHDAPVAFFRAAAEPICGQARAAARDLRVQLGADTQQMHQREGRWQELIDSLAVAAPKTTTPAPDPDQGAEGQALRDAVGRGPEPEDDIDAPPEAPPAPPVPEESEEDKAFWEELSRWPEREDAVDTASGTPTSVPARHPSGVEGTESAPTPRNRAAPRTATSPEPAAGKRPHRTPGLTPGFTLTLTALGNAPYTTESRTAASARLSQELIAILDAYRLAQRPDAGDPAPYGDIRSVPLTISAEELGSHDPVLVLRFGDPPHNDLRLPRTHLSHLHGSRLLAAIEWQACTTNDHVIALSAVWFEQLTAILPDDQLDTTVTKAEFIELLEAYADLHDDAYRDNADPVSMRANEAVAHFAQQRPGEALLRLADSGHRWIRHGSQGWTHQPSRRSLDGPRASDTARITPASTNPEPPSHEEPAGLPATDNEPSDVRMSEIPGEVSKLRADVRAVNQAADAAPGRTPPAPGPHTRPDTADAAPRSDAEAALSAEDARLRLRLEAVRPRQHALPPGMYTHLSDLIDEIDSAMAKTRRLHQADGKPLMNRLLRIIVRTNEILSPICRKLHLPGIPQGLERFIARMRGAPRPGTPTPADQLASPYGDRYLQDLSHRQRAIEKSAATPGLASESRARLQREWLTNRARWFAHYERTHGSAPGELIPEESTLVAGAPPTPSTAKAYDTLIRQLHAEADTRRKRYGEDDASADLYKRAAAVYQDRLIGRPPERDYPDALISPSVLRTAATAVARERSASPLTIQAAFGHEMPYDLANHTLQLLEARGIVGPLIGRTQRAVNVRDEAQAQQWLAAAQRSRGPAPASPATSKAPRPEPAVGTVPVADPLAHYSEQRIADLTEEAKKRTRLQTTPSKAVRGTEPPLSEAQRVASSQQTTSLTATYR